MNTQIKGNLSLTRNAVLGGNLIACGNVSVKGRLLVEGWLDAPHIKTPCKGLFADEETLRQSYPNPRIGLWALVGNAIPAQVYIATSEGWTATGEMGGATEIDLDYYDEKIDQVNDKISELHDSVGSLPHPVSTKSISNADLVIADEREQPILTVSGGHIRTANFNSANITGSLQPTNPGSTEINNGSTSGTASGCSLLRVMSWNIGHFAGGMTTSTAITGANYVAALAMWQKALARYSPDVIALQEYEKIFATNPTKETGEVLLPDYSIYPKSPAGGWSKNSLATLPRMSNICAVEIEGENPIAECTINVGSKQVYLCSAHAPWSGVDKCRAYHRALIDRFADKEYVIIGMDTNVRAEEGFLKELKLMFRRAGYQFANWGHWGEIDTYFGTASPCLQALDNVFVKGADIVHVETYVEVPEGTDADPDDLAATPLSDWQEVNPSDHAPIIADILFR